ncbi:MAG: methylmalonyl-CoA epimerase [Chlorobi bacterium]|nr:methylmalonyl-CoA epimerase [Chlorobiota bacterium]
MKVSHIGIAVGSLEEAVARYSALFGNDHPHRETVAEQRVDIASYPVGDAVIELTSPTDEASPIAKFIAKRGEGIHHIAFEVDDVAAELDRLRAAGVRLINETPTEGAHDMLIAFVHPSSFNGVLVELCQKKPSLDVGDVGGTFETSPDNDR